MTLCVLGLGSNRSFSGHKPLELLSLAVLKLKPLFSSDFSVSSIYITKAMYVEDQEDFYNMCVSGKTDVSANELLSKIHVIEASLGRNRENEFRNGPRPIDIDIELFGNEEIDFTDSSNRMNNLQVPHPRLKERAFVLAPLLEVLPETAEIYNTGELRCCLEKTGGQGIKKVLSPSEFLAFAGKAAGEGYGRADTSNGTGGCRK